MKRLLLASAAVLVLAGSTAVYAQHRPWSFHRHRANPEDRAAFLDARIAAVHTGLRLTPDQDKLWPPLETAVRDLVKLRTDRANARMQVRDERRAGRDNRGVDRDAQRDVDPVARLRQRAEAMGDNATALKRVADAADPLYKTLDDGQKRHLAALTNVGGRFGERDFGREMRRFNDDGGDRFDRGRRGDGQGREFHHERDLDGGPERL